MVTEPIAAPGELELVRAFVNTLNLETGEDELAAWLTEWGVRPTATALARTASVREALRELLIHHNGLPADVERATETLDRAARKARLSVRFVDGEAVVEPAARGYDRAVGRVLAAVATAVADGTWQRLKACRSETCRWAFYDHARNRSRTWCSMDVCGNRSKVRRYRARHTRR